MKIKRICCIGAGYVGGPTMAVIAHKCPEIEVNVVDVNEEKIKLWNSKDLDKLPVFEPGLPEIVRKTRDKNLFFTTDINKAIDKSEMIFMSVNTPTKTKGEGKGYAADLTYVRQCAKTIADISKTNKIVVEKSTLPVKTAEMIKDTLNSNKKHDVSFEVISNPEFLAEGTAINDLLNPDRVLIGGDNSKTGRKAVNLLVEIYKNWIQTKKIITTNVWSSELSKLVSNAFLAQRISSINSISAICEKTGADVDEVSKAVGMDKRIGSQFLKASIGFGGSCFKKDILNLVYISRTLGLDEVADYWESVVKINSYQTKRFANNIKESLNNSISNKLITIYGWAFKKNTNDSRESASIYLAKELLINGAIINVYDPMVESSRIQSDIISLLKEHNLEDSIILDYINRLSVYKSPYRASLNSNLIAVCTEWEDFIDYDWKKIYNNMKHPAWVFEGRNILDIKQLEQIGFQSFFIGKK
jgi:UDPglucose 6-dehydrogenase